MSPPPAGLGWGGFFDRRHAAKNKAPLDLSWGAYSVVGNFRPNNEDRFFVDPLGRFFLVADGMGGQSAGERASALAAEVIPQVLAKELDFEKGDDAQIMAALQHAVSNANTEIISQSTLDPLCHNMGTTLALLLRVGNQFHVVGLGDSPVYRLHGGNLAKLTTDHSLTQALVDAGTLSASEAANHRYRNVLYRYLGTKEGYLGIKDGNLREEIRSGELEPGDRFLICSDGALDGLNEGRLRELLTRSHHPQKAAEEIVNASLTGGSRDNITAIVVFVGP
ncbi:MAG: PP2C family protein-serine/threonine phosphatase [Planctomycetaceae bacterium]